MVQNVEQLSGVVLGRFFFQEQSMGGESTSCWDLHFRIRWTGYVSEDCHVLAV